MQKDHNATTTERRKQFVELGELGIPTTEHRKELKVSLQVMELKRPKILSDSAKFPIRVQP